ncbi:MAG: hypothetical protein OEV64_07295 [Desulfobulbaceae bacterium]|nr:hypothetical protein [Desulfobulbaceae bacterium]
MIRRNCTFVTYICTLALFIETVTGFLTPHPCQGEIPNESFSIPVSREEEDLLNRGEIVIREIKEQKSGVQTFEAIGRIKASGEKLSTILTDFENYPAFMPNVHEIEILSRSESDVIMNYVLELPLGQEKKYRLKISGPRQKESSFLLHWSLVPWPELKPEETIKDTTGYWLVQNDAEEQCLVLYHVSTDPGDIPFGLGWIVDILTKQSVPGAISALRNQTAKISLEN